MSRTSIKGLVLVDLVAVFTEPPMEDLESTENMNEKSVGTISQHGLPAWEVYVNGASNHKGSGIRLVLIFPKKVIVEKSLRLDFSATNNEASMKLC